MAEQLGYCETHGVIEPLYESFLGTYHCPRCLNYVRPATKEEINNVRPVDKDIEFRQQAVALALQIKQFGQYDAETVVRNAKIIEAYFREDVVRS